ncbi:MAG TPA: hypothetical protein VGR22_12490, partial [Thermomicrobiales bacterium]|nr:hypothetical protein [Thermomicrobiales bacterium]
MEIVPSYRPAAVQPMEMLSCLECGDPIRYALNPHVSIRFDTSPPSLKYGDRKVDSTYRAFVGDFCDRCALQYASDADRPSMLRD